MEILKANLKFKNNMGTRNTSVIDTIVLHHACGVGTVNQIHKAHLNRGWAGIGYNFYIRANGDIYLGRPIQYIPSHCQGHNTNSIGICLEGDFRVTKPTTGQINSMIILVQEMRKKYNIKHIYNHRDLNATLCPVVNLKEMIK